MHENLGDSEVGRVEILGGFKLEAVVLILAAEYVVESVLVGYPYDGVQRAQGADTLWRADEFFFVGKPEFEFNGGIAAFSQ